MTNQGDFATHRRDGEVVIKVLDVRHPAGAGFVAAAQRTGVTGMNTYLSTLRAAGVTLPADLSVQSAEPLTVRHRWVNGPVLLDYASVDPQRFVDAVAEIAQWVRTLDVADARIDTNLANFCVADNGVVLIDVLPPLMPSLRPKATNLFDVLFTALCFDTTVILDSLIGYAARALLRADIRLSISQREYLTRQIAQRVAEPVGQLPFPQSWFRARVTLALRALAGETEATRLQDFFTLTSVRTFRDLPEEERAHLIRRVDQMLKESSRP
ncbi:MAG TPA: hypothetical protein VF444_05280 [Pseudonocardiaceae bacterium]